MSRHLAIGDIHGCRTALAALLDYVAPERSDTIVTLGDYIDRGPDAAGVVERLLELDKTHNLVPLRGNHEVMLLDAREQNSWFHAWLNYGGEATLKSYSLSTGDRASILAIPPAHLEFLEHRLLPYGECDSHFFVHAHVEAHKDLAQQSDAALYWRRYVEPRPHRSGKVMVCGHSAQRSGVPANDGHSVCIDTCAYGEGGWLTCLDVTSGTVWQANEGGQTRCFRLGDEPEGQN